MWRADRLVRLFPRAWRERYGEEFVAMAGPGPLGLQQMIDIVSGAIDAWLSADVRDATRAWREAPSGGGPMMKSMTTVCARSGFRYTTRDGLVGAAVMLVGTALFALLGIALRRQGWSFAGETLTNIAFTASLTLSMPFWLMKGQSRKAQIVIVAGTLGLLLLIASLAQLV